MTIFAATEHVAKVSAAAGVGVVRQPSRRDKVEALGLLLGMLGILLGLALTVGGGLPIGQ